MLEAGELAETVAGGVAAGGTIGGVLDAGNGAHPVEPPVAGVEDADEEDLRSLSSPWQWIQCMHTVHRPVSLAKLVLSLSAGPRRIPM